MENQRGKPSYCTGLLPWEGFQVTAEEGETEVEPSSLPESRVWSWESGESKGAFKFIGQNREEGWPLINWEHRWAHVFEETTWGQGKSPLKD